MAAVLLAAAGAALLAGRRSHASSLRAPKRIDVFVTSLPRPIDPYRDPTVSGRAVLLSVFETLVRVDADGRLVPGLAEAWTSPTPDVSIFALRRGVRFHDGTPLTAAAAAAALEEGRRSRVFAAALADVVAVEVIGRSTLKLRTRGDASGLVYALSGVPIARRTADGAWVGTGPYLVRSEDESQVRLVRFLGYQGPRPWVEEATFRPAPAGKGMARFLSAADAVVVSPSREVVRAVRGDARYEVDVYASRSLYYLSYDLAKAGTSDADRMRRPFRDARVRRALRLALDAQALADEGAPMGGDAATQMLPAGVFGYDPRRRPGGRDVVAARRLLAEAGLASGFAATLDVSPVYEDLGRAVARQLRDVGVRIRPESHSPDGLRRRIEDGSSLFLYNWVVGKGSGLTLASFLHTRQPSAGLGLRNTTGYSNPRVDALLEAALGTSSERSRAQFLQSAMRLLMDDLPAIPLFSAHGVRVRPRTLVFPERGDGALLLAEARPRT